MKRTLIALVACFYGLLAFAQHDNRITIGTVDTVYSGILKEKRIVYVHVPQGDNTRRYPVLYILDGDQHFQSAVAINEQISGVTPPMIIVGITNTNRERDLTPTKVNADKLVNEGEALSSGGGENFMAFIQKELMPYIEKHYHTLPYRVFSGHSLGGLAVMNAFVNHTEMFNAYIALDPSIWWDKEQWIKNQDATICSRNFAGKSLYIAMANNMPPGIDTIALYNDTTNIAPVTHAVLHFTHDLRIMKPTGLSWISKYYPNERHGTVELVSEYDALRYLFDFFSFSTKQFIGHPELDEDSVVAAHYKIVSQRMGFQVPPSEDLINNLAYDCMARKKWDIAYKLFKRNIDNHPQSSNAWDSLGDYYADRNDKPHAREAYQHSLTLHETADTRRKFNEAKQ